ncbi:DUF1275 domain-containing protein [Moraxella nasovis]|uniref:YoaK family protein n=1 Tax=Moraxella nasovis TaxID=2904121 RepID=UPI001F6190AD|nr:YoaK family protein [Moraxella nasovis]UNU73101.1 DUF1275 domain-containing protein [Moraxella nasovis]
MPKERIPLWVMCGAVVLAFCAGMLNVIALMGFTNVSASHVTGNVSLLVTSLMSGDWINVRLFLISIAAFWSGSVLSGMIIGSSELNINRNYGYAMYLEAFLLIASLLLYLTDSFFGQMMIAMACGLQNSMVTTYSGTVVRTTHLTGTTSDLGAAVGRWLMGGQVSLPKIVLQSALWWGFFGGGFVAVVLYARFGFLSMVLPITVILFAAMTYQQLGRCFMHYKTLLKHKLAQKNNP